MSDQIIIEFIGDPSGLKPAEDALRGLGKSSQDTIAAFEKANTAAKHFAEGAKEAATAIKSTGDAAEKSVKAISSLSQAISSGAVKAVTEDFKNWAKEVAALGVQKGALKQKLSEVTAEMARAKTEIKAGEAAYAAYGKQAKALEKEINSTAREIDKNAEAVARLTAKKEDLSAKASKARDSIEKMNGTSEEGSAKYNKLVAAADKYESQIAKTDKAIIDHMSRNSELGTKNEALAGQFDQVKARMDVVSTAAAHNKERYNDLGKESKTLKGEMAAVDKELAQASKSFGGQSKAAEKSTKSHGAFIDQTKKLVGALTELGATTAAAAGQEAEASAIRQKGAETIDALTKLQTVATGATELFSDSMKAASLTSKALGQAARGAWAEATLGLSEVIQLIVTVVQHFDEIKAKFEAFAGAMRRLFGMKEVKDHAAILKENIASYEQQNEKLEKQINLMQAQGASAEQIARVHKEQLDTQHKLYTAQLELARSKKDETAIKEAQQKLDENALALIRSKKELEEAHLDTMREEGASEKDILLARKAQNDAALTQNEARLTQLKVTLQLLGANNMLTAGMQEQVDVLEHQNKVLKAQAAEIKQGLAEQAKAEADHRRELTQDALEQARHTAELRLATAKEGSEEELKARLAGVDIAAKMELNQEKLTLEQIRLIKTKLAQDTAKEIQSFYAKALAEEEKDEKKTDEEKYNNKMAILARERTAIANNAKLSADQKVELYKQVNQQEDAIWQAYNSALTQKEKQAAAERLAAARTEAQQKLAIQLQLNDQQYKADLSTEEHIMLARKDQHEKELSNAKLTIKGKMELNEQYYNAVDTSLQKEMQLLNKKYANDIAAAQKDEQAMEKLQDQYLKDSKAVEEKITANKKEQGKKREELQKESGKQEENITKQVGQKLIEMAKQVSDAIFENQKQKRDNDLKDKLDHLEEQKSVELMNANLTAAQRKAIEKKYKREEAHEKEKAWKADQKAKAEQAVINGLLAFTAALASSPPPMNYINAAIALASAGVQAGIIMSKTPPKFAKGVVALEGPGTETSDSIPAYLSKGESVITASATRRYKPLLEAMNAGTMDRYMPLPQMPDVKALEDVTRTSHRSQPERIDYEKIGEALARRIHMKQLNVSIDEKGFTKSVVTRGQRITSYNDRMRF